MSKMSEMSGGLPPFHKKRASFPVNSTWTQLVAGPFPESTSSAVLGEAENMMCWEKKRARGRCSQFRIFILNLNLFIGEFL